MMSTPNPSSSCSFWMAISKFCSSVNGPTSASFKLSLSEYLACSPHGDLMITCQPRKNKELQTEEADLEHKFYHIGKEVKFWFPISQPVLVPTHWAWLQGRWRSMLRALCCRKACLAPLMGSNVYSMTPAALLWQETPPETESKVKLLLTGKSRCWARQASNHATETNG